MAKPTSTPSGRDMDNYNTSHSLDLNISGENGIMDPQLILDIILQVQSRRTFDTTTEIVLIAVYTVLIVFGSLGNGMVCYVVARNSHMRTPRNIFIINLAISDLTLCLFTQPLNLFRLLNSQWLLGGAMCKFVAMCQGTNVFVSTISITAIALDRFQVIVYPTRDSFKKIGAAAALITIWIIAFLMASPLLIFSVHKVEKTIPNIEYYSYRCIEDESLLAEKGAYSIASMLVQYVLPIVIVTIAHAQICNKLKYRMVTQSRQGGASPFHKKKNERQSRRKRKTNVLLSTIAVVFALSWMPLNLFNILTEFQKDVFHNQALDINLAYVICHTLVLSSACTNPVLYGWLNENFRIEFVKVLRCHCCTVVRGVIKESVCCGPQQQVPVIVFTKEKNGNTGQSEPPKSTEVALTQTTELGATKTSTNVLSVELTENRCVDDEGEINITKA